MQSLVVLLRKRSLFRKWICFNVLSVENGRNWQTVNEVIEVDLNPDSISFPHNSLLVVEQEVVKGKPNSIKRIISASQLLPEILESLSKLKVPENIIDATALLPDILQALSKSNLEAQIKAADKENEIETWKDSLTAQKDILDKRKLEYDSYEDKRDIEFQEYKDEREVQLKEYEAKLDSSKQRITEVAQSIKEDRLEVNKRIALLNHKNDELSKEQAKFRIERAELSNLMKAEKLKQPIEVEVESIPVDSTPTN